jgi:hypothetical protein
MRARRVLGSLGVVASIGLAALLAIDINVRAELLGHLYADAASAPSAPVTLVLGAEVHPDGRPSPALQSRLDLAIDLLERGKTNVAGDERRQRPGRGRGDARVRRRPRHARGGRRRRSWRRAGARELRARGRRVPVPAAARVVSQADHAARAT